MKQLRALTRSILLNIGLFWAFHSAVFVGIALAYHLDRTYLVWFFISSCLVNGLLTGIVLYARQHFYNLETGQALTRVNFANQLTLLRVTSLSSILILLIASQTYDVKLFLIIYAGLAFVTDTLDGFVSRQTHQTTRIGQYLDSISDYGILLGISIAILYFGFIPAWFFGLVVVRFLAQWVAMGILFLLLHGTVEYHISLLSKASVAVTMSVFGLELLKLFAWFDPFAPYLIWLELFASLVLGVSLVEKGWLFAMDIRRILMERAQKAG